MLTLNDGRSDIWQWDTGRTLSVDADCSQVHFSNKVFGRSIDVDVIGGTAIIPDVLLQTDKDLNVWAFVGTAENGYTKISKTFKVNRRNKPADYVFTPPDQTTLAELVERLDKIEESQDPDAIKNAVEGYLEQNPVEAPVKSVNGKTGAVELNAEDVGAISQDDLQTAANEVLAQAKASGEFDGADGIGIQSVEQTTTSTEDGGTNVVTVTRTDGTSSTFQVKNGSRGQDATVDASLTQSGKSADAAVVGNRLSALSEEIVTTSESKVAAHNTGTDTHSDIRLLIHGLTDRLNVLADSDDTTLDQLSEVVAYIKSNRDLISSITTDKVSVADIVDNLTTNVANKPLSAAQGVALKALIDAITVPDKLPNPNALTFTGAVTGSYDGSSPLKVEIPSGGSGGSGGSEWQTILTGETTVEAVTTVTIPMTASDFDEYRAVIIVEKNTDGTTGENNTNIWIDGYCCAYYMIGINYGNYIGTFSISVEPIPETAFLAPDGSSTSAAKKSTVSRWINSPTAGGSAGISAIICPNTSPTGVLRIQFGKAYSGTIRHEVMAR